jgi:arylamine N-acetyltransferase
MSRTYSPQQVAQFLKLLDVPLEYHAPGVEPSLQFLRVLHTHMISTIPFETLDLHYTKRRQIQLEPEGLFQKLVANGRGRGGYCLENNQLFLYMLRDLGFQVYPVGAKIRPRVDGVPQGEYMCWSVGGVEHKLLGNCIDT